MPSVVVVVVVVVVVIVVTWCGRDRWFVWDGIGIVVVVVDSKDKYTKRASQQSRASPNQSQRSIHHQHTPNAMCRALCSMIRTFCHRRRSQEEASMRSVVVVVVFIVVVVVTWCGRDR